MVYFGSSALVEGIGGRQKGACVKREELKWLCDVMGDREVGWLVGCGEKERNGGCWKDGRNV